MTVLIIMYAIGLLFLLHPVIDSLLIKKKRNRQINVYIDETNKIAIVSPNKKASDKDISIIAKQLNGLYKTVLRVGNDTNLKGLKRK